jgi:hypothetical protein
VNRALLDVTARQLSIVLMLAPRRFLLGLLPALLLSVELGAAAAGNSAGSPFMPAGGAPQVDAAPTQDAQLELRGIMASGDVTMFSIYDSTRRTSYWIRLNDAGHEFVVRNYDAGRDVVTVEYQGRTLTLGLKTAKVASAPVTQPMPPMSQPQGQQQPPIGGPVVLNPTPADEQRRLEAIAAEVNRRRMVRQQAMQANRQPGAPGGPPMPQPPNRTNPQR